MMTMRSAVMADKKEENKKLVLGKPIDQLDLDDLDEAIDRGEIKFPELKEPDISDTMTLKNLEKFLMGEITFAQFQGITMDEAYAIAEHGYSLFQSGRYHDSREVFEALAIVNPYDAYFHNMLGAIYHQLDMTEEALEEYDIAIDLDQEHLHAYVNRGEMRLEKGEFEGALADLRKAIELDPDGNDEAGVRARALAMATAKALQAVQQAMKEQDKD